MAETRAGSRAVRPLPPQSAARGIPGDATFAEVVAIFMNAGYGREKALVLAREHRAKEMETDRASLEDCLRDLEHAIREAVRVPSDSDGETGLTQSETEEL
jgi:hypothetical protein